MKTKWKSVKLPVVIRKSFFAIIQWKSNCPCMYTFLFILSKKKSKFSHKIVFWTSWDFIRFYFLLEKLKKKIAANKWKYFLKKKLLTKDWKISNDNLIEILFILLLQNLFRSILSACQIDFSIVAFRSFWFKIKCPLKFSSHRIGSFLFLLFWFWRLFRHVQTIKWRWRL